MFNQVLNLVAGVKDLLDETFLDELVSDLRDICFDYAKNNIDQDSLRNLTKNEITAFTN